MRRIAYNRAIREAMIQAMQQDSSVIALGCGMHSPLGIFGTVSGLLDKFGPERAIETPVSENGITGIAIGAAITGLRPVLVHQRIDFILLSLDQIVNHAAKLRYISAGKLSVPLTIRCIIGFGWGQGAQHSQSFHAALSNIPGLRVVMPSNGADAKGLLASSIYDNNPVIFIEHQRLYRSICEVNRRWYKIPLGKARLVRPGSDVTIIALSALVEEAQKAARILKKEHRINSEIIDPRTISPLDRESIMASLRKTGRIVIAEPGWQMSGFGAEIAAFCACEGYRYLKAPVKRIAFAQSPAPTCTYLECLYHPDACSIVSACLEVVHRQKKFRTISCQMAK